MSTTGSTAGFRHVGRSVPRAEDRLLVNGQGRYLADLPHADALELTFVRSSYAHAEILEVDVAQARRSPGVVAVLTGSDLSELPALPVIWQQDGLRVPDYFALARERVHYVGQPVAMVVARTRAEAEDAAERVDVEYRELPVVTDPRTALEADQPLVHPEFGTNEACHFRVQAGAADEVFSSAAVVVEAELEIQRQTALPMEGRGVLVRPAGDRPGLDVWVTVQHPHLYRDHVAEMFGLPIEHVRVTVPDLGGAFGAYYQVYPEEITAIWVARRFGIAVRWLEDRQESFLGTVHARQQHHRAALALDQDGRVLALRDEVTSDLGAYIDYSGAGPTHLTAWFLTGPYDVPVVDVDVRCVFTNKVRSGAYRGFGQPEATFVIERLIDTAAAELGMDPVELRRRNVIRPDRFPYQLASGATMDSADLPGLLESAAAAVDYDEVRAEQRRRGNDGSRRLGIGVTLYTEFTGSSPSRALGDRGYRSPGWEGVTIGVGRDGAVTAFSGVSHLGQGARTAIAQIAAERLAVDPAEITVVTGDTGRVRSGNRGSVGSRSAVIGGQAANQAATELADRLRAIASELLEVPVEDLILQDGHAQVRGVPTAKVSFGALSDEAYRRHRVDAEDGPLLEVTSFFDPPGSPFGSGAHAAVVEVDTRTGAIEIIKYVVVHDCGNVINPAIVEGQVLGGSAQGIGGALLEELIYDEAGQLRTASMMDYLSPTASEVPEIEILHQVTPSPLNPLGVKGAGEAGTVGPAAALASAVSDALGTQLNRLPLSPCRVWEHARTSTRDRGAGHAAG